MKWILALGLSLLSLATLSVQGQSPDDQYVQVYRLIQDADQLRANGESQAAKEKYLEAQAGLKKLQLSYPNWNDNVIAFRLNYVTEKLNLIAPQPAPTAVVEPPVTPAAPPPAKPAPVTPAAPAPRPPEVTIPVAPVAGTEDARIKALTEQVRRLETANAVLEAKLKEALAAQPAAVDPRELVKAEERIKLLEKQKDLLEVTLQQEQARQARQPESALLEALKKKLAETEQNLTRQTEIAVALAQEKQILQGRLETSRKDAEAAQTLRAENETLRKQLTDAIAARTVAVGKPGGASEAMVSNLQALVKTLQTEKAELEKAKRDLEIKLAAVSSSARPPGGDDRAKLLEIERDDLLKKLNETTKQLSDNKARAEQIQRDRYEGQLTILRARLEALEARRVPYTAEELALFKPPPLMAAKTDPKSGRKPLRELPRGAGPLLAEAERAFATRRYDEAEKKFIQVLRMDEKNVFTLANLAASQLEQNRLADAEVNLEKALAVDPADSHSLSLLGILKFRQEKFDDALDALSRAALLDPQNPETQNYLGITLSQKGQRAASESALRRAIQLAPGYGGAHHNLAVIYATQQPPFTELARWHYQKALASGHPPNPALEKMIEGVRTTPATK